MDDRQSSERLPARELMDTTSQLDEGHHLGKEEEASVQDDYGAVLDGVIDIYRRRISALRRSLPRHELAAAVAALIQERQLAIGAIKEKRNWTRPSRRFGRRVHGNHTDSPARL